MRSTKSPSWIKRLLGLDPVAPPPHVFALDARSLKYGSFRRGTQGLVFDVAREAALDPELAPRGPLGAPLPDPRAFAERLGALLEGLPGPPVREASLVLPDTWLRLIFTEITDVPRPGKGRQEVLRWKLKRLVPFRVEDLRLTAVEVTPFPGQEEPHRLLLGFAIDALLNQIENAFRSHGIELGRVISATLALWAGLENVVEHDELAALLNVADDAFTLSYLHRGELLLYRYKSFGEEGHLHPSTVRRDLRLASSFMRQHFPQHPLRRAFVAAASEEAEPWLGWLGDELEIAPELLGLEHFPLERNQAGGAWPATAPLLGAACFEVA